MYYNHIDSNRIKELINEFAIDLTSSQYLLVTAVLNMTIELLFNSSTSHLVNSFNFLRTI